MSYSKLMQSVEVAGIVSVPIDVKKLEYEELREYVAKLRFTQLSEEKMREIEEELKIRGIW